MKHFILLIPFLALFIKSYSQPYTVSGYIRDAGSGETLTGATVYISGLQTGGISNQYGFYSITLPRGIHPIEFSFIGYETLSVDVDVQKNHTLNISLKDISQNLNEVIVSGTRRDRNVEGIEMSRESIPVQMVKKLPSFMGETDVLKTITLLPGIQNGGEGSSGLYVRGGGPDQNLLILDEAPVYNASHLMGFFSVFNSDAIKDMEVYKGGIPAQYGGKASSVIDIRMKEGHISEYHGQAGIGNISSRLTLEGPVIKDKWSFIVSGRRTYADVVGRMAGIEQLKENQLYFYDLNLKTNIRFSDKNRLFISAYTGDDYFKLGESLYMKWGNITTTARWNHIFGNRLFSNTSLIYSKYRYNLGVPGNTADQFDWNSLIEDLNFKEDFTWYVNSSNKVNFGINIIKHHFEPGNIDTRGNSFFEPLKLTDYNAINGAVYASSEQMIGPLLTIKYGLRLSVFQQTGEGKVRTYQNPEAPATGEIISETTYGRWERIGSPYIHPEPRISMKLTTGSNSSVKASWNRMVQNVHLISNTNSPTPLDIWLPTSKYIKPLISDQAAAGYFMNFAQNAFETSVEVYYKNTQNVLDFRDGAQLFLNENMETELLRGKGYAYGLEFLLKKQEGKVTGWLGYTLARTMRKVPGINEGRAYPSTYDRTHDVSFVLNYDLNQQLSMAANWVYSTGNPVTFPAAKYEVQGNTFFYYPERNSHRIPDYHRLDCSVTWNPKKNVTRKVKRSLNVSLYNVYARRNAYSVFFRQNEDNPAVTDAVRLSIIGTVIPSVTYNINF